MPKDAKQLFDEGNLPGAIAAVTEEIKAKATDSKRRTFLFELLCFAGEFERAGRQLDVIAQQDSMAEPAVQVYRNVLTAETQRRRFFSDGLKPEFLLDPPDYVRFHLEAVNRLREKKGVEAKALLEQSESARQPLRGQVDGTAFEGFRDCDDLLAPFLELLVLRDYVLVPFDQIREIDIPAPERPRDLLWGPARLVLQNGEERRGYVPVIYYGSHREADDKLKLGRLTDWVSEGDGPILGRGQRLFLAGEDGRPFLEVRHVEFQPQV